MGNSIFQNFSVESLYSSATPDVGLGETPHLFLLLFEALTYCGKLEVDEDRKLKGARQATDESLTALAENVNELANFALENETEIYWAGFASKSKKVDECSVFALAFAGLFCGPKCSVSHAQISGIAALWLLDNAITEAKNDGVSLKFVEALSEAALYLSQAASVHKDIYLVSAERNEAARKDVEFTEEQSKKAAKNAAKRHAKDPKKSDKDFVFECWKDWQEKPTQYKSKADFARAMLEKCEHLISHKIITDWCRSWEAPGKSVTLLAE